MLTHVDETLAQAAREIFPNICPRGYVVVDPSPGSLEECTKFFQQTACIGVDRHFGGRTSIFADPHTHRTFNGWHDFCHVQGQCTFDIEGERRVDDAMKAHLTSWWVHSKSPVSKPAYDRAMTALSFFNLGRLEYWRAYGEPPANPRQFLLGYLTAQSRILVPVRCPDQPVNEWTTYL